MGGETSEGGSPGAPSPDGWRRRAAAAWLLPGLVWGLALVPSGQALGGPAPPPRQPPAAQELAAQEPGAAAGESEAAGAEAATEAQPGLGLGEALALALLRDPAIAQVEARRDGARGSLLFARGDFDTVLSGDLTAAEDQVPLAGGGDRSTSSVRLGAGLARLFRSGFRVEPRVDLGLSSPDDSGGASEGTVSFLMRQPLLQGRGRAAVASAEIAARRELVAAGFDLEFTVSQRMLEVATRYWTWRAAEASLRVLRASEASSERLLETTRQLVEADLTPAADVIQLEADVTFKQSSRLAGERDAFAARQDLGREIGLTPAEIAALPRPGDAFPAAADGREADAFSEALASLLATALARRADLAAAGARLAATDARLRAAANDLKPVLDLVATPSYSGRVDGDRADDFFGPLYRGVPGPSASVGLVFSRPLRNDRAEGALLSLEAVRREQSLGLARTRLQIGADVPAALDAVLVSDEQLERSSRAIDLFARVVENEDRKLQAGRSTLVDVITQRDRLTAARQSLISARLALALALARLRFETGTLVVPASQGAGGAGPEPAADPGLPGGALRDDSAVRAFRIDVEGLLGLRRALEGEP